MSWGYSITTLWVYKMPKITVVAGNTKEKGKKTVSKKPVDEAGKINDVRKIPEIK